MNSDLRQKHAEDLRRLYLTIQARINSKYSNLGEVIDIYLKKTGLGLKTSLDFLNFIYK